MYGVPILKVDHLSTHFFTDAGVVRAVDDVSLTIDSSETLAIVGESGCGKSMTALSILGLVPTPPGRIVRGAVRWRRDGGVIDLVSAPARLLREIRGAEIAMIFQEPMTALNPVMRVGDQIAEVLEAHGRARGATVRARVVELLTLVGIPEPVLRASSYPHELSGGMRQRAMIAMALACEPSLLIADEPTTALDVTIQAQILVLLKELKDKLRMALILITHDFGVVANVADRVAVMYAGRIVETAPVRDIFAHPRHPYTEGLLKAIPPLQRRPEGLRLATIPGTVPNLARLPVGCPFQDRCYKMQARCRETMPPLEEKAVGHMARCYFPS
ncbi:MAG: ABC transporter ATP-binding protein [Deltaproteobacteria bacterium]|nr:ABC transporter ATP-binding protein [Deltaproteobacteria bacterium]